ncbi:MAG: HAMP domain-containing sensor histidine kinase [Burkholderia sp.]
MRLPDFIEAKLDDLIHDWAEYADALSGKDVLLSQAEQRDSARELLLQIARDMRKGQSARQRHDKSRGATREDDADFDAIAALHADTRLRHRFDINDVIAEYRALRASVLRRWQQHGKLGAASFEEMIRFNEAIDQGLTVSARRYAERSDRIRELFSGALVHDLRSPLGVVMNSAELLCRDTSLSPGNEKASALIRRGALRIRRMVDDLLVFSLVRLGESLPIECSPQRISALCRDAVEETLVLYPDARIDVRCENDGAGTWDGVRISQLIANLLANAVRYGRGEIVLEAATDARWMTLTVANEGDPIPEAALPTLFDPLTRASRTVDHRGLAAGAGLGLYICRCIALAHRGELEVASAAGKTTFALRIPLHVDA